MAPLQLHAVGAAGPSAGLCVEGRMGGLGHRRSRAPASGPYTELSSKFSVARILPCSVFQTARYPHGSPQEALLCGRPRAGSAGLGGQAGQTRQERHGAGTCAGEAEWRSPREDKVGTEWRSGDGSPQGMLGQNSQVQESSEREGGGTSRRTLLVSSAGVTLVSAADSCLQRLPNKWQNGSAVASPLPAASGEASSVLSSPALASLASRVSTFTLPNGMRWVVLERRTAPVVSCHTYADVGASDEDDGLTGIAHLLEHLAFKGTSQVGTVDAAQEAVILDQLDEVFYELRDAREAAGTPEGKIANLEEKFARLQEAAAALAVPNEYGSLLSQEGAVGLNAVTSQDATQYYVTLPANKLELWMALESGRFISPVFRELYSEKEVVKEERRLRIENSPYGRITEEFLAQALPGEPYARPTIGYPADLERMGRREVEAFFQKHYKPSSLMCAVVGDVDPAAVEALATKYFGAWEPGVASTWQPVPWGPQWRDAGGWDDLIGPKAPGSQRRRSGSSNELRVSVKANSLYMEGYRRPSAASTDDPALSVLTMLLSGSRSSRFYRNLILPGRVLSASADETFPGDKYPSLFLISAYPQLGSSPNDAAKAVRSELARMADAGPTGAELDRIRKAMQVSFLEALGNNGAMASALCSFSVRGGSWTALLDEQEAMASVTPEDIKRVASNLFSSAPSLALFANRA